MSEMLGLKEGILDGEMLGVAKNGESQLCGMQGEQMEIGEEREEKGDMENLKGRKEEV